MARLERFRFRFTAPYRPPALLFGVTPRTAHVSVGDGELDIRFGPWRLRTDLANVHGAELTGPYAYVKTAGPARLSWVDSGITFATNGERGVCIRFREPVPAFDPLGVLRHAAATVTVTDSERLRRLLTAGDGGGGPATHPEGT